MKLLFNVLLFQMAWFATVIAAAADVPWIGPVVVALVVAIHLAQSRRPRTESGLILVSTLMGLAADSLILATAWVSYPNGTWVPGLAPYWIVMLWAVFATTLNVSMRWLHGRYLLAAAFGAVGGPLSYLAGARLGAMSIVDPVPALAVLALVWALAMPLLAFLAARLDGNRPSRLPAYVFEEWSHG